MNSHFKKKYINFMLLVFILLVFESISQKYLFAQSIVGTSGLINIPSAEIAVDSEMRIGISYVDVKYVEHLGTKNHSLLYYGFFNFLPFVEVGVRFTKQINHSDALGDRLISIKINLMEENSYLPSLSIGSQDFYFTEDSPTNRFNSTYIVSTKNINLLQNTLALKINFGHGFKTIKSRGTQYIGLFGGLAVSYSFLTLILENDAVQTNIGLSVNIYDHIFITGALMNLDYVGAGISTKFRL